MGSGQVGLRYCSVLLPVLSPFYPSVGVALSPSLTTLLTEKTVEAPGPVGRHFAGCLTTSSQMGSVAPAIPLLVTSLPLSATLVGPLSSVVLGRRGEKTKIANSFSNYL